MQGSQVFDAVTVMLDGGPGILLPRARDGRIRTFTDASFDAAGTPRQTPGLVLFTSGSTGAPKGVALSVDALTASARATEDLLAGPGRWHLCLPVNHIAGLQVVLRALLAGAPPTVPEGGSSSGSPSFNPSRFGADILRTLTAAGDHPVYTSLVPTQLTRVLSDPAATQALARCAAVLLGGASISPRLLERAAHARIRIVRTYGMSETAGGCVYDGLPFPDVTVRLLPDCRIVLAGPVLADGYVQVSDSTPTTPAAEAPLTLTAIPHPPRPTGTPLDLSGGFYGEGAQRFLVTSDLGRWDDTLQEGTPQDDTLQEGARGEPGLKPAPGPEPAPGPRARIAVLGRADDVIVTGGENVSPHDVETALLPVVEPWGFSEVLVTSRDDEEWGEVLVALLVTGGPDKGSTAASAGHPGHPDHAGPHPARPELLAAIRTGLLDKGITGARVPRHALLVTALPAKSIGKPDREAARLLARSPSRTDG